MATVSRRIWRLFLLLALAVGAGAQTLPTTTVSDTVYRADGQPASGVLLISWPEFITSDGHAVAAGRTNTTLGAGGALSVALVPNAGATPANTVYTVVYQLDDIVRTEFWIVPTTSPANLAVVRTVLGAANSASQMATQQFVNSALAAKANDNDVVHVTGNETINGVKQFATAPSLPAPVNPNDAVSKQYVDGLQTVGSGSYVSKAGDTMSGPLTLSGPPSAANQAANKGYIDSAVNAKADLTAGLVPVGELGAGSANNGLCLHGDSTWGACGSSANAVSIQGVSVDPSTPTDNEVITYVASQGKYVPKPGGSGSTGMQAIKYATDFAWTQSPSTDLSIPGAKTVSFASCGAGVAAAEPYYYVYISGTGTPEAVGVTGGTCAGNGQPGTLQFTTANSHPVGYTVTSASGGLQEALIAARIMPTNPSGPSQAGKVIVPPAEISAYARISIRSSDMTVDFSGSIVNCYMQDTCIFVGDPMNTNAFLDVTLVSPRGRPMVVGGQSPFIEDNAQKTRILNLATRIPPTGGTFGNFVQVDGDQSFLLDGLDTALATGSNNYGLLCNAAVCNPAIYAPGPFATNAAVGWLKNLNISLQCAGNGIDWESGNSLRISDSVVEGFAQYGVKGGIKRGGYSGIALENVYEEVGNCANPAGNIGQAGVIAEGATVKIEGRVAPSGGFPQFANTGTSDYRYYVVAKSATYGASNPLLAGHALTNGTGTISVSWPDVPGASSFDLLRTIYNGAGAPREQAPYGSGAYAVATGLTRAAACANGACTFADTQAALQNYTVANPSYFPLIDYWPGNLVLSANVDSGSVLDAAVASMDSAPSDVVAVEGVAGPALISNYCDPLYEWSPLWMNCYSSRAPSSYYDQTALLLPVKPNQDGGLRTNLKGRLNFPTLGSAPSHIITLSDSNFQKTIATANNRPSNDVNDAFIGYDQGDGDPTHVGISMGAPVSLSNYIGNVGDGKNWLERLTGGLKEFKTNVQMDGGIVVSGNAQAAEFTASANGSWALQGGFGALSPVGSGKSAIGFGGNGKLQVSENGGAVVEVAKLDASGNLSENANTATQLVQTPTQCNGSFATGIQANGNAVCSTADVVQLAETSQPTGIPNYGIFWFDTTCHCPKVISNNGQPIQLGLLNVFNSDANTMEERNGGTPQALRIYQSTDSNELNYSRLSFWYDSQSARYAISSDYLGNGSAYGIEFKLGGTIPWYIGSNFHLLTGSDNLRDIGADALGNGNNGLGIRSLYYATALDGELTGGSANDWPNDAGTGTSLNKLAKLTASGSAVSTSASDTGGAIGVVIAGAGTTYNAEVVSSGFGSCTFDGPTTTGDYVQMSGTVAGDCHDAGAVYPTSGQVLGRVMVTNAAGGTYKTYFFGMGVQGASSSANNVGSVFGRVGSITAQAGDYSVGQVTGAAPLASPALTGTPTAPTQPASDSSAAIATDAFVKSQNFAGLGSANSFSGNNSFVAGSIAVPTPSGNDNSANAASTAWVASYVGSHASGIGPVPTGYPLTGNGTGAGVNSSPSELDATAFTGADACAKMKSAMDVAISGNGAPVVNGRGFINDNMGCANPPVSTSDAGQLLLPSGVIQAQNTWMLGQKITLQGTGRGDPSGNTDTLVQLENGGTGFVAAPVLQIGPASGCSGDSCIVSGTLIKNLALDANGLNGTIGIKGDWDQEETGSEYVKVINPTVAGFAFGNDSLTNRTQNGINVRNFEVLFPNNAACGPWPNATGAPLSSISRNSSGVVTATLSAPLSAGGGPWEQWPVVVSGVTGSASSFNGSYTVLVGTTPTSTTFTYQQASTTAESGTVTAANVKFYPTGVSVWTGTGTATRGLEGGTVNGSNCSSTSSFAAYPLAAYEIDGTGHILRNSHAEGFQDGVVIGSRAPTSNVTIENFTGEANLKNGVIIGNTNASASQFSVTDIDVRQLICRGGSGSNTGNPTNCLIDNINGNTLTFANNPVILRYWLDSYGAAHLEGGNCADLTNGWCESNGARSLYKNGSVVFSVDANGNIVNASLSGTPTAPTPSNSDNSTKVATTAYVQSQGYISSVGPYSSFWALPGSVSTTTPIACSSSASKATIWGISLNYPLKTSNVAYYVQAADNTGNTYDLGLYSSSGTLIAHTGSLAGTQFAPTQGYKTQAWTTPNTVIQPGNYYLALACSATTGTATFGYTYTWAAGANTSESVSTAGSLPTSITVPGSMTMTNATTLQAAIF